MKKKDKAGERQPNMVMSVVSGAVVGAILSMVLIIVYALVLKQGWLSAQSISGVNTAVKLISAAAASAYAVRRCPKGRWVYGALSGGAYTVVAFLVFSILARAFSFSVALLSDIGMGVLSGMFAAMLVGLRR